jgi:phosphoglycolate phosphatase-like HAD superfamily hydrolase
VETLFEQKNVDFLNELAEAILPKTSTPGAKEANVGAFIPVMIRDCYATADQNAFVEGLAGIDQRVQKEYGKNFLDLTAEERFEFVNAYDIEAKEFQKERGKKVREAQDALREKEGNGLGEIALKNKLDEISQAEANHFFTMLKQLTLTGFFTSEVGMTQALRYVKIPGKYDGNYPYKKGDRAFA